MNIYEYTQGQITSYPHRTIELYGVRQFNQHDLLQRIAAYSDSHYTSSMYDDLGRRKPFYNINQRILHKQRTAEDIDTKDMSITTTRPAHYAKSLLISTANKAWMKRVNFAKTLNKMTEYRGRDGGLLVKRVMNDGVLDIEIVDLLTTITDPTDIPSGVKIQTMLMNPAELVDMKKRGWENVEDAIVLGTQTVDDVKKEGSNPSTEYIKVYVVEGVLPRNMVDAEAEDFTYSNQMHVITLYTTEDGDGNEKQEGITLYSTEKKASDFKYLPYEEVSGRSLGRGMVEQSFEAQMAINEVVINEKNTMEIASKSILVQPQGNGFTANNILTDVHDGSVLDYNIQAPTVLNSTPSSLGYNQTLLSSWQRQVSDQTSVQDVNTGNMPASATFRGMALQNQEANSIFELRREEMAIFLKEIYQDWIIPYLKEWVSTTEFLELELSPETMEKVINDYAYTKAKKKTHKRYFEGAYDKAEVGTKFLTMALDTEVEAQRIKSELKSSNKRWLKTNSSYLKDVEFQLDIVITDEQRVKQVYLANQIDILNTYLANKQAFMSDPNAMKMYNQIQQSLGLSPLENIEEEIQPNQEAQAQPVELESLEVA